MASSHFNPMLQLAQNMAALQQMQTSMPFAALPGRFPAGPATLNRLAVESSASPAPAAKAAASSSSSGGVQEEEVPRCHLHRKQNKACKYCKAYFSFQEARSKEIEERRTAALEKLKEGAGTKASGGVGPDDTVAIPNFAHFPQLMRERIASNRFFNNSLSTRGVSEVKEALFTCDTCEPEIRGSSSLDTMPSPFFCGVYRLLTLKLTESQMRGLLNNRSRWVRCAGFVFVRLGVHQDRYWDLLSDALLDQEEFVPFPDAGGGDTLTEGQYVEQLLTKEKYCELSLPRIAAAQRRTINERLVLYEQFRRRYAANLEALDRFQDPEGGVQVEVCRVDGEWSAAETTGPVTPGRRRVTVPVRLLPGGTEQSVSIGMVICPGKGGASASSHDLTRSRGRSYQELLDKYREQQRDAAVASGKDYCKTSGRHTVHAGGMTFICGEKRRREGEDDLYEDARSQAMKKNGPSIEHQVKMAAIMEKYCASKSGASARSQAKGSEHVDGPERMRLG